MARELGSHTMSHVLQIPGSLRGVKLIDASHTATLLATVRAHWRSPGSRLAALASSERLALAESVLSHVEKRVRALRYMVYSRHSSRTTNGIKVDVVSLHLNHFTVPGKGSLK